MLSPLRGWRWRPNPLRRRSDVMEAWTTLVVTVLLVVGTPLAGLVAGWWAHTDAQARVTAERAALRRVSAVVLTDAPAAVPSANGGSQPVFRVQARWTEPAAGTVTGPARVPAGTRAGDLAEVWLDGRGRSVGPPATGAVVWQHTLAMGACAAGGAAVAVLAGHLVVRRVALRHRMEEWDREWARTGPEWARRWA
ncbi:Rv1733c family protein [Streptomyces poonensis]|nr:hypothetical protein [Streptomyces poonensis]